MHQFTVDIPSNSTSEQLICNIQKIVESAGGTLTHDGTSGNFVVKGVTGNFTVTGNVISITLKNKPWYSSYGIIESYIRKNITLVGI